MAGWGDRADESPPQRLCTRDRGIQQQPQSPPPEPKSTALQSLLIDDDAQPVLGSKRGIFTLGKSSKRGALELEHATDNEITFAFNADSQQQWTKNLNMSLPKIAGKQTAVYYTLKEAKKAFKECEAAVGIVLRWIETPPVSSSNTSNTCQLCSEDATFSCMTCTDVKFCSHCVHTNHYHDDATNFKCPICHTTHYQDTEEEEEEEGGEDKSGPGVASHAEALKLAMIEHAKKGWNLRGAKKS